jgi:hypothetical protein
MDVDIICKFLKINKGGVGGTFQLSAVSRQPSAVSYQNKSGALVVAHKLIVRLKREIFCNCSENDASALIPIVIRAGGLAGR